MARSNCKTSDAPAGPVGDGYKWVAVNRMIHSGMQWRCEGDWRPALNVGDGVGTEFLYRESIHEKRQERV